MGTVLVKTVPNGLVISIQPLDAEGKPLDVPDVFVWTPGAITELEGKDGGAMRAIGEKTSRAVRRALTTLFPPAKKIVLPNG